MMRKWILLVCMAMLAGVAKTSAQQAPVVDKDFGKFWKTLRTAVVGKNRHEVMKMTHFPVENLICHDIEAKTDEELPKCSKEKFKSCYYKIFSRCLRKQFIKNRFPTKVTQDKKGYYRFKVYMKYRVYGKRQGEGTVTLVFSKIGGTFKIIRIVCAGICGGDC
ncbi:hypothetical protein [Microscilla marina]|nr:hypothetical protein [Microscilla marina]